MMTLKRLERLATMPHPELACRSRQEASKWMERLGVRPRGGHRRTSRGALRGAEALLDDFRLTIGGRFFAGATSPETAAMIEQRMPAARSGVVAAAEAAGRGRFDLLGHRGLFFGDPVDWHLDPISGRRAPLLHWSRVPVVDPGVVGDSKVIWELNRHQWLVPLGQAYALTGDERHARRWEAFVQEWLAANPPGMGINWASSLEVALRLISWCWALCLFRRSPVLSPETLLAIVDAIEAQAAHVERYLSHYFSPNTHLTGEALGLFYAGVAFPTLPRAARWRVLGAQILVEQSGRQILRDGVYFEQSLHYQRYTVETYLHFLILAGRNRIAVPRAVAARVERMLDFLLAMRRPDGSMPQVGDADGGQLLPLAARAPDDLRGVFATAAALFRRTDYAWAAGGPAPEPVWLLGPEAVEAMEARRPTPPRAPSSRLFVPGGYAVMSSGWEGAGHHLIFDVGPLGCPVSGAHGHADLLSVQCSAFGDAYLVDPGTYGYGAAPEWRDFFRGTGAHSTVLVDGVGQALPAGPFAWHGRPRARLRQWLSTGAIDVADAEHDAYRRLPDPVVHRRRVVFVKPRYWLVVDDLRGAGEHRVELRFQFAPMPVGLDPAPWARAHGPGGSGLLVRAFAGVPLDAEVVEGGVAPIRGWVSPDYGRRLPAPLLTYSATARLPLRVVTLLWPSADPLAPPPRVSCLAGDGPASARGLAFEETRESVTFDGPAIMLERTDDR